VGRVLSEELRRFFQSEKLRQEFLRLMAGMTVEVSAQIRLVPSAEEGETEGSGERRGPKVVVTEVTARRAKRTRKA
ncbi:MAG TPA: hypothetical protein VEY30_00820, partial [Myxococcaceae bacterium]|nr:hypothetical protein [Myxococcaceae bacterium]